MLGAAVAAVAAAPCVYVWAASDRAMAAGAAVEAVFVGSRSGGGGGGGRVKATAVMLAARVCGEEGGGVRLGQRRDLRMHRCAAGIYIRVTVVRATDIRVADIRAHASVCCRIMCAAAPSH